MRNFTNNNKSWKEINFQVGFNIALLKKLGNITSLVIQRKYCRGSLIQFPTFYWQEIQHCIGKVARYPSHPSRISNCEYSLILFKRNLSIKNFESQETLLRKFLEKLFDNCDRLESLLFFSLPPLHSLHKLRNLRTLYLNVGKHLEDYSMCFFS